MTKLGEKLENPYSVENMKKAWEKLKSSQPNGRISGEDLEITATHLYIQFKPKSEDELAILQRDSTLILYTYPLDYEIEQAGDFYHDPELPLDRPTYQYCAVAVDKKLPEGVEFEILEELFIPDEDYDDDENQTNGRIATSGTMEALVDEALLITGNLEEEASDYSNARRSKWRPAGTIRVWDENIGTTNSTRRIFSHWEYYDCGGGLDEFEGIRRIRPIEQQCKRAVYRYETVVIDGSYVGLSGAKVRARRWFTTHEGITDANGRFSCNGRFRRDANYSIKWERNDFDIRSGSIGQAILNGPKRHGDWNHDIRSGSQRMYAIVNQASSDYYYGNRLGLKSPPRNSFWKTKVKISVWDERDPDSKGSHCKDCRFLGISSRIRIWNNGVTFMAIYGTTIHELAHASHWELRKNNWKDKYTERKVKESWARGVQWAIGRLRYPNYRGGPIIRPDYTQVVVDMIDGRAPLNAFGNPIDINNGSENLTEDDVAGYTIQQIEDVLGNTSTWENWENNIRNRYNNGTEENLDELFNHWD
jgi:hypothetical protein